MQSGDTQKHASFALTAHDVVWRIAAVLLAMLLAVATLSTRASAQDLPPQRQLRTFIPPDQIVSFLPSTAFDTFLETVNPIFVQVTGKRVIDPESRQHDIGVSIVGMQFFDALELVLEVHRLRYRETERYFIIEPAPDETLARDESDALAPRGGRANQIDPDAFNAKSREVEINAVLFEIDHTNTRQIGLDWGTFWGEGSAGGGQSDFALKTDELFEPFEDWLVAPNEISFSDLNSFFRLTEQTGMGHTVASPSVTVGSGKQGRIQIGSDIPVQVRDFAGNTITQFVSTGVIINVTPTVIQSPLGDTLGAPVLEFIHLDVRVERSNGRPFSGSVAIDRAGAETDILLLDGETTIIGGLYGTDENVERVGIPILKDLPWWVFGFRYIFGRETVTEGQTELLIALQASLRDDLPTRAEQPFESELRNRSRERILDLLRRFDQRATDEYWPEMLRPFSDQEQGQGNPGDE